MEVQQINLHQSNRPFNRYATLILMERCHVIRLYGSICALSLVISWFWAQMQTGINCSAIFKTKQNAGTSEGT